MRHKDLISLIRAHLIWIIIFILNTLLFVFLAWLAYPQTFAVLVRIMIVLPFLFIVFGLMILKRSYDKKRNAFELFLREPDHEKQEFLVRICGEIYKDIITETGEKLREVKDELAGTRMLSSEYQDFIENWVHEIKTPLALLALVLENRKDEMSDTVYIKLEHVRADINDDIEKILYYARSRSYHSDKFLSIVDLSACFQEASAELSCIFEEKGIILTEQIGDHPVVSDYKALRFIFSQILMNSVKYSSEKEDKRIIVKTGKDEERGKFFLTIEDNGEGVHAADLPFIFDKAFGGSSSGWSKSTGMGLYLVQKLCDDLKIDIMAGPGSDAETGFVITLLFPL